MPWIRLTPGEGLHGADSDCNTKSGKPYRFRPVFKG